MNFLGNDIRKIKILLPFIKDGNLSVKTNSNFDDKNSLQKLAK